MKRGVLVVFLVILLSLVTVALAAENNTDSFADNSWGDSADMDSVMMDSWSGGAMDDFGLIPAFDIDRIMRNLLIAGIIILLLILLILFNFIMFFVHTSKIKKLKRELDGLRSLQGTTSGASQSADSIASSTPATSTPMVSPELRNYIASCQSAGMSKQQIQQILLKQGYDSATLNFALQNYQVAPHQ